MFAALVSSLGFWTLGVRTHSCAVYLCILRKANGTKKEKSARESLTALSPSVMCNVVVSCFRSLSIALACQSFRRVYEQIIYTV